MRLILPCLAAGLLFASSLGARAEQAPAFRVRIDPAVRAEPASGRLLLFLLRPGANVRPGEDPASAPFYDDPQPILGVEVDRLPAGATLDVARDVAGFPGTFRSLPAGEYRARAVFDLVRSNSDWRREPGNLMSEVFTFEKRAGDESPAIEIALNRAVERTEMRESPGLSTFETRSALLSAFRGEEVRMRAGVIQPKAFDPAKKYPALYIVPGFSGDHRMAFAIAAGRFSMIPPAVRERAFIVVLDPESPNGHTLFADSANNGPCGRALVEELIPALEAEHPLIAQAGARFVTGHSSGGWSSLWLALQYPKTFGACFSGAPDPVDFRAFQSINLYEDANFYVDGAGAERASNIQGGKVLMTVRQENQWEEARGPRNSSGQQWDSWQAVFAPRGTDGLPAALFDPVSGAIDRGVAHAARAYDISLLLERDAERLLPLFRDRVHIVVGGADEWNLHAAVAMLQARLAERGALMNGVGHPGSIRIVPGASHGSVVMSDAYAEMYRVLTERLERVFKEHNP